MLIQPSHYSSSRVAELIRVAGEGKVGIDQRFVAAILAEPEEAGPALIAYGLNPPESARVELDVDLLNLLATLREPKAMDYVVDLLRQGFTEIPESMIEIAHRGGQGAVDALLALYREMEEDSAGEVAFLVAGLGIRDARIFDIILERLEFDMEDGAMLLGLYGDPAGIAPLEKLLREVGKNRELEFALEQLRVSSGEFFSPEIDHLADYPDLAGPEFEVLDDDEIVEFATKHEDEAVRLAALDVLEDLELPQSAALPLLELAGSMDSLTVRSAAFRALARLNQIEEVRVQAEAVLSDSAAAPALQAAALITLLPEGIAAARVRSLIDQLVLDPAARPDAIHAMWRSREAVYANRFGTFLDDPDLAVRRQAIRGAGVCGDVTAVGKLRDVLMDEELRSDAIFAYALALPVDISPSRMRSLYSRIEKDAGGLNHDEATSVGIALDMRLESVGKEPVFFTSCEDEGDPQA